jgi:hypothetical protein
MRAAADRRQMGQPVPGTQLGLLNCALLTKLVHRICWYRVFGVRGINTGGRINCRSTIQVIAQALNKRLLITNDFYIRTTMEKHKQTAKLVCGMNRYRWGECRTDYSCITTRYERSKANGDIYSGTYEGWSAPPSDQRSRNLLCVTACGSALTFDTKNLR